MNKVFINHTGLQQKVADPSVAVLLGTVRINDNIYQNEGYAHLWSRDGKWGWFVYAFGRSSKYRGVEESYEEAWNKINSSRNLD